jgi:hypothetical protein
MLIFVSCPLKFSLPFPSIMVGILYNLAPNFSRSEIQHSGTRSVECWRFFQSSRKPCKLSSLTTLILKMST